MIYLYINCVCICVHKCHTCRGQRTGVGFLYCVGPRTGTQISGLHSKCLYLVNLPAQETVFRIKKLWSQSPTSAGAFWYPVGKPCWPGKWCSGLHSPLSPPSPIPQSHTQLCTKPSATVLSLLVPSCALLPPVDPPLPLSSPAFNLFYPTTETLAKPGSLLLCS